MRIVGLVLGVGVFALAACGPGETREEKAQRMADEINKKCDALGNQDAADQCRLQEYLAIPPEDLP